MEALTPEQLQIRDLGECKVPSPVKVCTDGVSGAGRYAVDDSRLLVKIDYSPDEKIDRGMAFENAGPRRMIYFRPEFSKAAVVTCGGLCPGLNNVIRSLFLELHHRYGVREMVGIRNGYQGLNPDYGLPPVPLSQEFVEHIHKLGGTVLGTSRGPQPPEKMVDFLLSEKIQMLFCVGGDGTLRGADAICQEIARRGARISVVGIPKTIDNDINYVWRSFGYLTALEKAREILAGAHAEAKGAPNGIALVKLMGRNAGFIAAGATVASQEVNYTLIPEVPFTLKGPGGFLSHLKDRILSRRHAVIVVAEGAGQDLIPEDEARHDRSGNLLHRDIGTFLKGEIGSYFREHGIEVSIKYFDPSYHIRSMPADIGDSLLCDQLARNAAHAAMAGKTGLLIGYWHNYCIHVPIELAIASKRHLSQDSELWSAVIASTGQPERFH